MEKSRSLAYQQRKLSVHGSPDILEKCLWCVILTSAVKAEMLNTSFPQQISAFSSLWGRENHSLFQEKKIWGRKYTSVGTWLLNKRRIHMLSECSGVWLLSDRGWKYHSLCLLVSDGEELREILLQEWHVSLGQHGKELLCAKDKDARWKNQLTVELNCGGRNKNYPDRSERMWGAENWCNGHYIMGSSILGPPLWRIKVFSFT